MYSDGGAALGAAHVGCSRYDRELETLRDAVENLDDATDVELLRLAVLCVGDGIERPARWRPESKERSA